MKAAIMRNAQIVVDDMAMPVPTEGEVLVKTLACGICGSDLHALKHGHDMVQTSIETGGSFVMDLTKDIVMGHEFCAEVLDYGPGTSGEFKAGHPGLFLSNHHTQRRPQHGWLLECGARRLFGKYGAHRVHATTRSEWPVY
jgi:threonine dehydrogenase-like Zn-dependent dehydrogenase